MKYPFTFILFSIFIPLLSVAQSNYKKGIVVTNQGDTLRGFIDYREWGQNPKSFSFKSNSESLNTQQFTPLTSHYFEIEGLVAYQQYAGRISMGKVDIGSLATEADTSTTKAIVFLKVLQKGKNLSLYAYRDVVKIRFFSQKNNDAYPQELIYRRYLANNGKSEISTTKIYASQLWNAAASYGKTSPELKQLMESASYAESDLVTIVSKINDISKQELAQAKKLVITGSGILRVLV
jgi:hypothetical protein